MPRTPDPRPLDVCAHEAAHVVVGVALGLRLRRAVVAREPLPGGRVGLGWVQFAGGVRRRLAHAIMAAAGVAWERATGGRGDYYDRRYARELVASGHDLESCVVAASALLATRGAAHAAVTRALLERDLGPRDIEAIARGEIVAGGD